jgi:hypothetical protein
LKLISSNGEAVYTIPVIEAGLVEMIIWEGMKDLTWSDGGRVALKVSDFSDVPAGSILTFYFQQKPAWGQAQINNGKWAELKFTELGNTGYLKPETYNDKSVSKQELELTHDILSNIIANHGNCEGVDAGIIIQGSDWIFTKVTITIKGGPRVDPVKDPSYVFFNFDGRNSWWGGNGKIENDPELSLDGSNYFRINGNLTGSWIDFFWRNGKDNFKTDGVTIAGWVVKMDVNVLGPTTPPFKYRFKGSDGDFWATFGGLENKGGWYTVTVPLTDFYDGGTQIPNVQNINEDFGLALAGQGETNICIDNVRFEPK